MKRYRWYRLGIEFGVGESRKIVFHFWRWSWHV